MSTDAAKFPWVEHKCALCNGTGRLHFTNAPGDVMPEPPVSRPESPRMTRDAAKALIDEHWVAAIEMWRCEDADMNPVRDRLEAARAALLAALCGDSAHVR